MQISQVVDPAALCYWVGKRLAWDPANCDHTFRHASQFLAPHAKAAGLTVDQVLDMLGSMGAHCDCEIGLNLCP